MNFALWGCASLKGYSVKGEIKSWVGVFCEEAVECIEGSAVAHKRRDNICFANPEVDVQGVGKPFGEATLSAIVIRYYSFGICTGVSAGWQYGTGCGKSRCGAKKHDK